MTHPLLRSHTWIVQSFVSPLASSFIGVCKDGVVPQIEFPGEQRTEAPDIREEGDLKKELENTDPGSWGDNSVGSVCTHPRTHAHAHTKIF